VSISTISFISVKTTVTQRVDGYGAAGESRSGAARHDRHAGRRDSFDDRHGILRRAREADRGGAAGVQESRFVEAVALEIGRFREHAQVG